MTTSVCPTRHHTERKAHVSLVQTVSPCEDCGLMKIRVPVLGSKVAELRPPTRADSVALLIGFILKLPPTKNLRGIVGDVGILVG